MDLYYIPELGDGWGPAILDREKELRFIKWGQTGLNDMRNYWIGGLTYSAPPNIIQYSEYYTIGSGTICSNDRG